jgi:hypothetical protein
VKWKIRQRKNCKSRSNIFMRKDDGICGKKEDARRNSGNVPFR